MQHYGISAPCSEGVKYGQLMLSPEQAKRLNSDDNDDNSHCYPSVKQYMYMCVCIYGQ